MGYIIILHEKLTEVYIGRICLLCKLISELSIAPLSSPKREYVINFWTWQTLGTSRIAYSRNISEAEWAFRCILIDIRWEKIHHKETSENTEQATKQIGSKLAVFKLPDAKKGSVPHCPGTWVIERGFSWTARFHRLVRDRERTLKAAQICGKHCSSLLKVLNTFQHI